jgi:ATP adenylyltransferase/5',5'''-P-1,P-4-tetraphosphate phosphorylase II
MKQIQNPSFKGIDPLDVKKMEKELVVYDFEELSKDYAYTLVLNKFNTIPDHVLF